MNITMYKMPSSVCFWFIEPVSTFPLASSNGAYSAQSMRQEEHFSFTSNENEIFLPQASESWDYRYACTLEPGLYLHFVLLV